MSNTNHINKMLLREWEALKPVYFQKWVWEKAVHHNPKKYNNKLPVYQGKKVILT